MKKIRKKKENPPTNGLIVDEGINPILNGGECPQNNKKNHP
jgi:hypothetical protein